MLKTEIKRQKWREWHARVFVPGLVGLLFAGALFWAKGRDPFQRVWFEVHAAGRHAAECAAVLPKMNRRPLPVVIYLHGSGDSLLRSGNELRQMAEMGLAAVGMEYAQTNEAACEAEFAALLDYVGRQAWADTNRVAWVGLSLGAQRMLGFLLEHPERRPGLLVRLAGSEVGKLKSGNAEMLKSEKETETIVNRRSPRANGQGAPPMSVLIEHGEQDDVFSVEEARRTAGWFQTNGVPVELKVLPGQPHGFGKNRLMVFRAVGEYCLTYFKGPEALREYQSTLVWQAKARPLWVFWVSAAVWLCSRWLVSALGRNGKSAMGDGKSRRPEGRNMAEKWGQKDEDKKTKRRKQKWEILLRWVAGVLAVLAVGQTALHLVPPRLAVSERTLAVARKHIVQDKKKNDFECLAKYPVWRGKKLGILLEHVELANYNRELINWKIDEPLYREFVLAPEIEPTADGDLDWRRPLWENFYPRIRKEMEPGSAAEIVVRFLRERVTIAGPRDHGTMGLRTTSDGLPVRIREAWERQITSPHGFECLYVAALRSVGVPARLDGQGRAEYWSGNAWSAAPRSLIEKG